VTRAIYEQRIELLQQKGGTTQSFNTIEDGEEEKVVNYFLMRKKKEE